MSLLNILQFPDPRLKTVASPVSSITEETKKIVEDMLETMYETRGVGLAATQVNIHQRIIVMDVSEEANTPMVLINPEIVDKKGEFLSDEGCLSFPGIYVKVKRAKEITFKYTDIDGTEYTMDAEGLLSVCVQHEIDHIEGITFYDRLSVLKQKMLSKKLEKIRKKSL